MSAGSSPCTPLPLSWFQQGFPHGLFSFLEEWGSLTHWAALGTFHVLQSISRKSSHFYYIRKKSLRRIVWGSFMCSAMDAKKRWAPQIKAHNPHPIASKVCLHGQHPATLQPAQKYPSFRLLIWGLFCCVFFNKKPSKTKNLQQSVGSEGWKMRVQL